MRTQWARLATNRNVGRVGDRGAALFAGRVWCKACRRKMHAAMNHGHRVYRCRPTDRATGKVICTGRSIPETVLFDVFCKELSQLARDEARLDAAVAHLDGWIKENQVAAGTREQNTRRAQLQEQIERAKGNLTLLPRERVPDQLKRLDALERELASLADPEVPAPSVPKDWMKQVRALLRSADRLASWLRTLPPHRQRDVVQEAVLYCEVEFERKGHQLVATGGSFLLDPVCLGVDTAALCGAQHLVSCSG